jgi:hypothetical protein
VRSFPGQQVDFVNFPNGKKCNFVVVWLEDALVELVLFLNELN